MSRIAAILAGLCFAFLPASAQDVPTHTAAFDGISFAFSENIARGIQIETVEAGTNVSPFAFKPAESPSHLRFTFLNYIPSDSDEIDREKFHVPVIRIYKMADLPDFGLDGTTYADEAAKLADILARRPDLSAEASLPFLPLIPGIQTLHARARYIENERVEGIAYLTHRADRAGIVLEGRVFYTFQGFSRDGRYFIAAWLSLDSGVLPVAFTFKSDFDQILENYHLYTAARVVALEGQADAAYFPPLGDLDALFGSLSVE